MGSFKACPACMSPGIKVDEKTVESMAPGSAPLKKPHACVQKGCDIAYFGKEGYVVVSNVRSKLWYKADDMDCPICYCSVITRGDIEKCVDAGCRSVSEVEDILGKTGQHHLLRDPETPRRNDTHL